MQIIMLCFLRLITMTAGCIFYTMAAIISTTYSLELRHASARALPRCKHSIDLSTYVRITVDNMKSSHCSTVTQSVLDVDMAACLQNAFKCYLRTRDYCTTPRHILQMCLNVIRVSLAMSNYMNVSNYVQKAETTPELSVCLWGLWLRE